MDKFAVYSLCAFVIMEIALAATPTNCTDEYRCGLGGQCIDDLLVVGNTKCVCYRGFKRSSVTFTCADIDECSAPGAAVCPNGFCQNLVGTYRCQCLPGYIPDHPKGRTCKKVKQNGGIFGNQYLWYMLLLFGGGK